MTRHVRTLPQHIPIPPRRFSHLHVDLVGPLPAAGGYKYLFTVIDRTTRWMEAVPLASTTADDCAGALIAAWVTRFGVPAAITSDRGPQFCGAIWRAFCATIGVQHITTTAYHPEGNGMVERLHRRLKDALRARCSGLDWPNHLPWVLLALRSAPREEDGFSPAQAVYGAPLALPADRQDTPPPERPLEQALETFRLTRDAATPRSTQHNTADSSAAPDAIPDALRTAERVLVRRDGHNTPLAPLYDGPYTVVQRGARFFKLQVGDRQDTVHVNRLKPFAAQQTPTATPPKRGRPRVRFSIPADQQAQMPGTVFPPIPPRRFFARPGSASTDQQRPQRLRRPPDRLGVDLWQAEVQGEPCGVPVQDPWSLNVFI